MGTTPRLDAQLHPSNYHSNKYRSLLGGNDRSHNYNSSPLSASTSSDGSTSSQQHNHQQQQQQQRFNPFLTSPTASTSRGPSGPSAAFLRVNDPSLRDDVDDVVRMRSGQAEFVSVHRSS